MSIDDNKTLKCSREALTSIVIGYCAAFIAAFEAGKSGQGLRLCRRLHATICSHLRRQHRFYQDALREDLAADRALRGQVRRDLGGRPAMIKWEMRKRHARKNGTRSPTSSDPFSPFYIGPKSKQVRSQICARKASEYRWTPKTDRTGRFRLASLSDGYIGRREKAEVTVRKTAVKRDRPIIYHPLEVSGEELRDDRYRPPDWDWPEKVLTFPRGRKGRRVDRWPR